MPNDNHFSARHPAVGRLEGLREDFRQTGFHIMVPSPRGEADLVERGLSPFRFMLRECGKLTFVTRGKATSVMAFGCEIAVSPHPSGVGALWSVGPVVRTVNGEFRAAPTPYEVDGLRDVGVGQYVSMYWDVVGLAESIRKDHPGLDWGDVEDRSPHG